MEPVTLAPGLVVAGKYVLDRPLARGAMGEVWIANHASLGGELAVKFLARGPAHEGEDEATAMARFRFEAQVASKLARRTRHIVGVTDHGEEWGYAYLVMELVEGESLESVMKREGRMSLDSLSPIIQQAAKGLYHAHVEGVFHRDLKPANILLTKDEDGGLLVKILDFGIAKTVRSHKVSQEKSDHHATEVGIVLGTPNYMSPEQARGLSTLDHRCDLWALCTVAYEALCGTLPYDGETTADLLVNICSVDPIPARTHRPDLPEAIDVFFSKAFAASVRDRFQDANELAAAFAEASTPKPVAPAAPAPSEDAPASSNDAGKVPSNPAPSSTPLPVETPLGSSHSAEASASPVAMPEPQPFGRTEGEDRNISGAITATAEEQPPKRRSGLVWVALAAAIVGVIVFAGVRLSPSTPAAGGSPPSPQPTETAATPLPPIPTTTTTATATSTAESQETVSSSPTNTAASAPQKGKTIKVGTKTTQAPPNVVPSPTAMAPTASPPPPPATTAAPPPPPPPGTTTAPGKKVDKGEIL